METLPKEIINEIKYFYQVPEIKIVTQESRIFYFCVKYRLATMKLQMVGCLEREWRRDMWMYNKNKDLVGKFIHDLKNNIDCHYNEIRYVGTYNGDNAEKFDIVVKGDNITIYNAVDEINLGIDCKSLLIDAMKKYQSILETYV